MHSYQQSQNWSQAAKGSAVVEMQRPKPENLDATLLSLAVRGAEVHIFTKRPRLNVKGIQRPIKVMIFVMINLPRSGVNQNGRLGRLRLPVWSINAQLVVVGSLDLQLPRATFHVFPDHYQQFSSFTSSDYY